MCCVLLGNVICVRLCVCMQKIDKSKLSEEQARLIDKHVSEGSLSALDAKPTYRAVYFEKAKKLSEKEYHFRIRVEVSQ